MKIRWSALVCALSLVACKDSAPHAPSSDAAVALPAEASAPTAHSADGGSGFPVAREVVDKTLNPKGLPKYEGPVGVIEGTVLVTGDAPPATPSNSLFGCPGAEKDYGKLFREAKTAEGKRSLGDAIVAITGYGGFYVPETKPAKLVTIEGCGFGTRTVTMTYGQVLEVKNKTTALFAPVVLETPPLATMMAIPAGEPVKLYVVTPGRFHLVDKMNHDYLTTDLFAFMHPLHTVTATSGRFRIEGVPAGKRTVNTTHPAFGGETSVEVEVPANGTVEATLTLNYKLPAPTGSARPSTKSEPIH